MGEDAGIPGIVRDGSSSVLGNSTHLWETVYVEHVVKVKRVMVPLSEDTAQLLYAAATRAGVSVDAWLSPIVLDDYEAHISCKTCGHPRKRHTGSGADGLATACMVGTGGPTATTECPCSEYVVGPDSCPHGARPGKCPVSGCANQ
jgi:hypothetical protein